MPLSMVLNQGFFLWEEMWHKAQIQEGLAEQIWSKGKDAWRRCLNQHNPIEFSVMVMMF